MKLTKKVLLVSLMLVMLLTGCHKEIVEGYNLDELTGWWVRPDVYESDGISLLDYFYLDGEKETWTGYNSLGYANGLGGSAAITDIDKLVLEGLYSSEDVEIPISDTSTLVDLDGNPYYVKVENPNFDASVKITGYWYKNGDKNSAYFYFDSEGNVATYDDGEVTSDEYIVSEMTGSYSYEEVTIGPEFYTFYKIEFENGTYDNIDLSCGNKAFILNDFFLGNAYYIYEDSLEDVNVKNSAILLLGNWHTQNYEYSIEFNENTGVLLTNASGKIIATGIWKADNNEITISWDDGTNANAVLKANNDNYNLQVGNNTFTNSEW